MPERDEDSVGEEEENAADSSETPPLPAAAPTTATHLLTDLESSTPLWQKRPTMAGDLARHDALLREHLTRHGGTIIKTTGDGIHAVFAAAPAALTAAFYAQRALIEAFPADEPLPLRVRIAVHTGEAQPRDGDYYGNTLNRASRILAALHGGQIGVSEATAVLVRESKLPEGVMLRDLGEHRLRDLEQPERIFQLAHPDLPADFPPLRAAGTVPHNLPRQLTTFIGREGEMAQVKTLLTGTPLLTIVGPGGSGKTRLALEIAADVLSDYADGIWFVDLAPLTDGALIPDTVAAALSVREEPGQPLLLETLLRHLSEKRILLILDNCEHLIDACATFAHMLLRRCPGASILATSREALGVTGEVAWPLSALSLPEPEDAETVEYLARYEAVRLFAERAASVSPSFVLNAANASAVARICRRLDGIPLAIELAAGWVNVLSPEQIETRLNDRFRFLKGSGNRAALPRQQTLRAAIDWSYDLLREEERILLRRLSVFAGGCTLEAAEAVCADNTVLPDFAVLDALFHLVRKSLVAKEENRGVDMARYRLLDTIRYYGQERIAEAGEGDNLRMRYQQYYLNMAEAAEPNLRGPEQKEHLEWLETEHDNLRAALTFRAGSEEQARLACALHEFWRMRGFVGEGRRWQEEALSRDNASLPPLLTAKLLNRAGAMAMLEGDLEAAKQRLSQSTTVCRTLKEGTGIANAQMNLGNIASYEGDYESARACYEESAAIYRETGDKLRLSILLNNLGAMANQQKDHELARLYLEEALGLQREQQNTTGIADALHNLAETMMAAGDCIEAQSLLRESLLLRQQISDKSGLMMTFTLFGIIHHRQEQWTRGVFFFAVAERMHSLLKAPLSSATQTAVAGYLKAERSILGKEVFEQLWRTGQASSIEKAVAFALDPEASITDSAPDT